MITLAGISTLEVPLRDPVGVWMSGGYTSTNPLPLRWSHLSNQDPLTLVVCSSYLPRRSIAVCVFFAKQNIQHMLQMILIFTALE